jgi:uncharacterized protein
MIDECFLSKATALLRDAARPKRIILFGSYARGDARPDSDVDLLVILDKVDDRAAEMVRLARVLSPLRLPVDLLVASEDLFTYWADTPGNVYFSARADGRVLYDACVQGTPVECN